MNGNSKQSDQAQPTSPFNSEVLNEIDVDQIAQPQLDGHMWRQEGNQLICQSCPFKHSSFIDPGYQLYGIDDNGRPLIRKIELSKG